MSDEIAGVEPVPHAPAQRRLSAPRNKVMLLIVAVLVTGVVGALVWHGVVTPPEFTVGANGAAQISEYAMSQAVAMDVWFACVNVILGLGVGSLCWRLFGRLGWPVAVVALFAGLVVALVSWQMGELLGPRDFAARMAAVGPEGGTVAMDFGLSAMSALLACPRARVLPVLLYSTLDREPAPMVAEAAREVEQLDLSGDAND
jgi:hypothetical protein